MTKYIVTDHNGRQVASFVMYTLDIAALDEMDEDAAELELDWYDVDLAERFEAACAAQGLDPLACGYYAL